jgi:hypothetical protein
MPQYSFGSGNLYATPSGANPTPVRFGTLQEVTLDLSFTTKKLYGSKQYPVAIGRGPASATASAKSAEIYSSVFNEIFAGIVTSTGSTKVANSEAGTVTTAAITVANSANFLADLGVVYAATGLPLKRVASAPTVGQYSVSAGVYGFNATENATALYISYTWNATGAGKKATLVNQDMGAAVVFSVVLDVPYGAGGTVATYKFYQAVSTKLSLGFKNEDFTIPQFDMEFFADAAGNVYDLNTTT